MELSEYITNEHMDFSAICGNQYLITTKFAHHVIVEVASGTEHIVREYAFERKINHIGDNFDVYILLRSIAINQE